jgi:hypothetical protein
MCVQTQSPAPQHTRATRAQAGQVARAQADRWPGHRLGGQRRARVAQPRADGRGRSGRGRGGRATGQPRTRGTRPPPMQTALRAPGKKCGDPCNNCPQEGLLCPGAPSAIARPGGRCAFGRPPGVRREADVRTITDAATSRIGYLSMPSTAPPTRAENKGHPACTASTTGGLLQACAQWIAIASCPVRYSACTRSAYGSCPSRAHQDLRLQGQPIGTCTIVPGSFPGWVASMDCIRDSDAEPGSICECGEPSGL